MIVVLEICLCFYMYLYFGISLFLCSVDNLLFANFGCESYGVTFSSGHVENSCSGTCMDLFVLRHS
jgi:hypothetical protein